MFSLINWLLKNKNNDQKETCAIRICEQIINPDDKETVLNSNHVSMVLDVQKTLFGITKVWYAESDAVRPNKVKIISAEIRKEIPYSSELAYSVHVATVQYDDGRIVHYFVYGLV